MMNKSYLEHYLKVESFANRNFQSRGCQATREIFLNLKPPESVYQQSFLNVPNGLRGNEKHLTVRGMKSVYSK